MNTRKTWCYPIKKKTMGEVSDKLLNFINQNKDLEIKTLSYDAGKEFVNKEFNSILKANNIKKYVFNHELS